MAPVEFDNWRLLMTIDFVPHAKKRVSQRGFTDRFLKTFYGLQDSVINSFGRECLSISRSSIEATLSSNEVSEQTKTYIKQNYHKLLQTILVQDEDKIITVKLNWSQK